MKAPAFSPGKFQPVVEVAQRDTGLPAPADTNFSGLESVAVTTLEISNASARGSGAVLSTVVPASSIGKVIGYLLACKNISEQLRVLSVYARVSGPLSQSPSCLEPIVRAYNYYGHFEISGKVYVTRALEDLLVFYLFKLRQWASQDICSMTKNTINQSAKDFANISLSFYSLSADGNIEFGKRKPLKVYLVELSSALLAYDEISEDLRIPVTRNALDISTEHGLTAFLRYLRLDLSGFTIPERNMTITPTDAHKAAMKQLFGQEYSSIGDQIPVAKFSEVITRSFSLLRLVTQERAYVMKEIPFPKYEGGSPSQLAELVDDVLYSEVPLSLDDSTISVALSTSYGTTYRYRSAPNVDRDETRRSIVSQSLVKR
jgi:hypothetical protein